MKRAVCMFLTLVLMLSAISCPVRAATISITCNPGETINVNFTLSEDGEQPEGVMGRLEYDTDVFTVIPSQYLIGTDGINILNREPVTISFRVSKYAPVGQYSIEVKVIEAYDADGKEYKNVRIDPVQVTVESAATATPERQPEPTPTGKPLPLPSADSKGKNQIKAGDYVTFGRYPQTAEGNDQTPIEWLVLDVQGNKALLLSRYCLDAKPYDADHWLYFTWVVVSLRAWLNNEFLNAAFIGKEQQAILMSNVDCSAGWGTDTLHTQDKLFLLSYSEATRYLRAISEDTTSMILLAAPTAYAIGQGALTNSRNKTAEGRGTGSWWLRSVGSRRESAALVDADGSLSYINAHASTVAVRPALWVNLDAVSF